MYSEGRVTRSRARMAAGVGETRAIEGGRQALGAGPAFLASAGMHA